MKRLRSSDDLEGSNSKKSNSHQSFYYDKPDLGRRGSSSSRFDRVVVEERDSSVLVPKRTEGDFEGYERRKGFDRFKDGGGDRGAHDSEQVRRSESFNGTRREFPKGFRSERDRPRREGGVSSWRRFAGIKDFNEGGSRAGTDLARESSVRSPKGLRDVNVKSPSWSKESGIEQSKIKSPKGFRDGKLKSPTWLKETGSEQGKLRSPKGFRDTVSKSPTKESGSEQSRIRSTLGQGLRDAKSPSWSKDLGGEQPNIMSPKEFRDVSSKGFKDEKLKLPTWSKESGNEQAKLKFTNGVKERKSKSPTRLKESGSEQSAIRSTQLLQDAKSKSPTWSKESGSEQSMIRYTQGLRNAKSPPDSKDSESEQSKSYEVKKTDEQQVGNDISSEMEEGELQPELEGESDPPRDLTDEAEIQNHVELNSEHNDVNNDCQNVELAEKSHSQDATEPNKEPIFEQKNAEEVNELPNDPKKIIYSTEKASGIGEQIKTTKDHEGDRNGQNFSKHTISKKSLYLREEHTESWGIPFEVKEEDIELAEPNKGVTEENGAPRVYSLFPKEGLVQGYKDKGKTVAVSPTRAVDFAENGVWIERGPRDLLSCRDNRNEGPSTRGFELFSSSPVKKPDRTNKHKNEKLEHESLDLSLSLPNVLLPIGAVDTNQSPSSPTHTRSVQSLTNTFLTNSEGFTASMSFSGSQTFIHNPSCSLTHNSFDNFEQSVGSHPIFQGIDQVLNDAKQKEAPFYQRLMNGNASQYQSQALSGMQHSQGNNQRVLEGNTKPPIGLDRQLSFQKQHSDYSKDKRRVTKEKGSSSSLNRSVSLKEGFLAGGSDFSETILSRIVSEPIYVMARKFHEMTEQSITCLKETVFEIMSKADKYGQLNAFQKVLLNRSDTTLDMLIKSHRAQLEILVSLKTGQKEFLQRNNAIPPSDLAEIFLNLRCRNFSCRSPLPVDDCDCKFCVQKTGFCSACTCLICLKFDTASNTCSWVGCDVCQHWCHTDCALRESYIRSGRISTGVEGTSEMQFHCVACNHPSEMFGFVKEVFQNFAKDWSAETLSKELEYVKRIFYASEDLRGKQLHYSINKMQSRLANKSNLPEVYNHVMGILTGKESNNLVNTPTVSRKEFPDKNQGESSNMFSKQNQENNWPKSVYQERAPYFENHNSNNNRLDKSAMDLDFERNVRKEPPVFDELESIVKMKLAEAKMFQSRADDAKTEAEGLKRIVIAKNEKTEEEFKTRITKLRISEAEELRKQKTEELRVLEKAHLDYFNMKMRMEADIKDLLSKMETMRPNITML